MAQKTARDRTGDATIHVTGTVAIPDVLKSLGADPAVVLAEAQLDPGLFDDPDNLISLAALGRLMKLCAARTRCQHFGLLVGQRGGLHSLGLVGLLVRHSPDVGTALLSLARYLYLHNSGTTTAVALDGEAALLAYDIHQPHVEAVDQIMDGALAAMFNIMRTLCGADWQPIEVWFSHRQPQDVRPYRRFFAAPLRFDEVHNALVFSPDWLKLLLPGADAALQRLLLQQIDALEARHAEEFPQQVRSVLRTALLTGHAAADQVAAIFSMHSRTLSRRLEAFGTSFRELVDECRFEIARRLLEGTALDVREVATSLDYADASAFTRAFRRWSGTTPAAWRATRAQAARDLRRA
jgi:AraC-like DNA-binding protein